MFLHGKPVDVWAFGAVLHCLVAAMGAFNQDHDTELLCDEETKTVAGILAVLGRPSPPTIKRMGWQMLDELRHGAVCRATRIWPAAIALPDMLPNIFLYEPDKMPSASTIVELLTPHCP